MDVDTLVDLFREDVNDSATPYLWSDLEVYSYVNEAQNEFVRLIGGIPDSRTDSVTLIHALTGNPYVDLSPLILKITGAFLVADGSVVDLSSYEEAETAHFNHLDVSTGKIRKIITNTDIASARLIKVPESDQDIRLAVYRMPLVQITNDFNQELEIAAQHHRYLLYWMKHLAHNKQDAETYDKGRAAEFYALFLAYCERARGERERREHKHRAVTYGGL